MRPRKGRGRSGWGRVHGRGPFRVHPAEGAGPGRDCGRGPSCAGAPQGRAGGVAVPGAWRAFSVLCSHSVPELLRALVCSLFARPCYRETERVEGRSFAEGHIQCRIPLQFQQSRSLFPGFVPLTFSAALPAVSSASSAPLVLMLHRALASEPLAPRLILGDLVHSLVLTPISVRIILIVLPVANTYVLGHFSTHFVNIH